MSMTGTGPPLPRSDVDLLQTLPCFESLLLLLVATIMRALTVIAIESALADEPYSVDADAQPELGCGVLVKSFLGDLGPEGGRDFGK